MSKNKGNLTLGKWHFKLGVISTYWDNFGYMFHFGIFKLNSFPEDLGKMVDKENYTGFWFRKVIRIEGFEISFEWPRWHGLVNAHKETKSEFQDDITKKPKI